MAVQTLDQNIARGLALLGAFRGRVVGWTGPSTYTTGGDAFVANGISTPEIVLPTIARNATTGAIVLRYDHATGKMQAFWGDNDAVADGALVEVANGTDLSAYTARLLVLGK